MDLLKDILAKSLENRTIRVEIPGFDIETAVQNPLLRALDKIRAAVRDDTLSDPDCFERVEKIISALEEAGSDGGSRHDF